MMNLRANAVTDLDSILVELGFVEKPDDYDQLVKQYDAEIVKMKELNIQLANNRKAEIS